MALVTAFAATGLSGCKSRTVSNEVTAEYDTPDDYNRNPDVFGYVGAFAPVGGVVDTGSGERVYGNRGFLLPELVKDGGQQPLVTLIVTGDSDPYCKESAINYSDYMTSHGINHIFYIRQGAHEVSVWNNGLYNFIRRIF